MKYCSKCGNMVDENQKFCPSCGAATGTYGGTSGAARTDFPKQNVYLALVIIGFFLGVLWGALSIRPYQEMKAAIARDDSDAAWENAKKVRTFFLIGLVINALIIVGQLAQMS